MKPYTTSFVASLATYLGGHFNNGRWARATLFTALLLAMGAGAAFVAFDGFLSFISTPYIDSYDLREWARRLRILAAVLTAAITALWLLSAVTAAFDARTARKTEDTVETPIGRWIAAAAMCIFGASVLSVIPISWYRVVRVMRTREDRSSLSARAFPSPYSSFARPARTIVSEAPPFPPPINKGRYLGITGSSVGFFTGTRKDLGPGDGIVRGKVRAGGEPVRHLRLRLYVAPDLETEWGISDAKGYYSISIPPGQHRLVGWEIDDESARKALAGKTTSQNGPFSLGYLRLLSVQSDGVTSGPDFEFVDALARIRPADDIEVTTDTVFEWEPAANASYYRLSIEQSAYTVSVELPGMPPLDIFGWRRSYPQLKGTTTTAAAAGYTLRSGSEFAWRVEAYDSSGTCIARTRDDFRTLKVK